MHGNNCSTKVSFIGLSDDIVETTLLYILNIGWKYQCHISYRILLIV